MRPRGGALTRLACFSVDEFGRTKPAKCRRSVLTVLACFARNEFGRAKPAKCRRSALTRFPCFAGNEFGVVVLGFWLVFIIFGAGWFWRAGQAGSLPCEG